MLGPQLCEPNSWANMVPGFSSLKRSTRARAAASGRTRVAEIGHAVTDLNYEKYTRGMLRASRRPVAGFVIGAVLVIGLSAVAVMTLHPALRNSALGTTDGTWSITTDAPIANRSLHSTVWSGTEVLIWGGLTGSRPADGSTTMDDGAAYDVKTDRWRRVSAAPIRGRFGHSAVWTGERMLIWGGADLRGPFSDGAAYDPETERWTLLSVAPLSPRSDQVAAWTGDELIIWGGITADGMAADGAAYGPTDDTWRKLAPSPISDYSASGAVWTGAELIVLASREIGPLVAAAYAPASDTWRSLLQAPVGSLDAPPAWTGSEVLLLSHATDEEGQPPRPAQGAYDPATDSWRILSYPPPSGAGSDIAAWTGSEVLLYAGHSDLLGYNPDEDVWRKLPQAPGSSREHFGAVWTGRELVIWGGVRTANVQASAHGIVYRPE
jgi:hypothetical protein